MNKASLEAYFYLFDFHSCRMIIFCTVNILVKHFTSLLFLVSCGSSSQQPTAFLQGGITSSLRFPFHNHIEDNVEFDCGGKLRKEVLIYVLSKFILFS